MVFVQDGSVVWARSGAKEKFWPSVVFRSWDAAKDAGFVPDGIAFLIEVGRKIDVTDAEAAPRKGELLNLYLGDNPEWEFIAEDESLVLPFKEHREAFSKQRLGSQLKHQFGPALAAADGMCNQQTWNVGAFPVSISHGNPKKTGALLDFGTGTSFASFAELWNYLVHNGWQTIPGKGLASWYYFPPGSDPKMRRAMLDRDYFNSEEAVINHVRTRGLERPAPVATMIPRAKPPPGDTPKSSKSQSSRSSSGKSAGVRSAGRASMGKGSAGKGSAGKASSASKSSAGVGNSAAMGGMKSGKSRASGSSSASARNTTSSPPVVKSQAMELKQKEKESDIKGDRGGGSGGSTADVGLKGTGKGISAKDEISSFQVGGSICSDAGGRESATASPDTVVDDVNGFVRDEDHDVFEAVRHDLVRDVASGTTDIGEGRMERGVVEAPAEDNAEKEPKDGRGRAKRGSNSSGGNSGGGGDKSRAGGSPAMESASGPKRERQGKRSMQHVEGMHAGSKRSHGRTMQGEAVHGSTRNNEGAPSVSGEVMRQTVTARELVSSPPAPSPSKRPKRAGPYYAPYDLHRLAGRQIAHLHALVSGNERPFPGPIGLEEPIGAVTKFVTEAHAYWSMRQSSSRSSSAEPRRPSALVLAGPGGTGKTTSFKAAMNAAMISLGDIKTLRFASIKCGGRAGRSGEGAGGQGRVYSKVLAAVTGNNKRVNYDSALGMLEQVPEPSFLAVVCLEDGGALEHAVLSKLMDMAYRDTPLFVIVLMVDSVDKGYEVGFEQGMRERDAVVVPMLPYREDNIRAILGQAMGASHAEDKDGEMIATLVNKGALDVIARTVARVCGSVRIALNVCIVAFSERRKELASLVPKETATGSTPSGGEGSAASAAAGMMSPGGASSAASRGAAAAANSPSSSNHGSCVLASVLLNVAGAKNALNKFFHTELEALAIETDGGGGRDKEGWSK